MALKPNSQGKPAESANSLAAPVAAQSEPAQGVGWSPAARPPGEAFSGVVPNRPFEFMFHPRRWDVFGGKVLPSLAKIQHQGGINGATDVRGFVDITIAAAGYAKQGWQVVPANILGESYVRVMAVPGGNYYLGPGMRLVSGLRHPVADGDKYRDFLLALMRSGKFPAPTIDVLEANLSDMEALAAGLADKGTESDRIILRKVQQAVAAYREAIALGYAKHLDSGTEQLASVTEQLNSEAPNA